MKIFVLCTGCLLLASGIFAQKNFLIGVGFGTGSTFTGVSYDDYRFQHMKGRYGPTFSTGIDLRKDFKGRLSFLTGVYATFTNYRAGFPYPPKPDPYNNAAFTERLRFSDWEPKIGVPIILKCRFPLKKNEDVALAVDAGFSMNFSTGWTGGETGFSYATEDSTGEATYAGYVVPNSANILLILGFGVDKIIGKRSLMNFSLLANIGTTTILNGEFYYYDHPVDFNTNILYPLKPDDVPTESYRFYSRNSSILFKVTYFFARRKLRG